MTIESVCTSSPGSSDATASTARARLLDRRNSTPNGASSASKPPHVHHEPCIRGAGMTRLGRFDGLATFVWLLVAIIISALVPGSSQKPRLIMRRQTVP
jgi:hypothetical protein